MNKRSNNVKIYRGVLEKEGLSEVAHYLRKAEKELQYAMYALDGTEFSDAINQIASVKNGLQRMRAISDEVVAGIDSVNMDIYKKLESREDKEGE